MANFQFNVNTDASIILTAKLERLNKIAFPAAVRSSLSDCAFYMKKEGIYLSAKKNLTIRTKTVYKKFTGVEKARFNKNIEQMKATVGFIPKDGVKGSKVPQGMESSEFGGTDKEGLMYLSASRAYKNSKKLVKKSNRYDQTTRAQGHKKRIRTNGGKSSVMAMMASWQEGKPVFIKAKSGVKYLVKVNSVFDMSTGKRDFKVDFLMRSRDKKPSKSKATHFVKEAALSTQKLMEDFYAKNAQFQFDKVLKSTI